MGIAQKVVIITGASQGMGAALVEAYRDRGYGVVATARSIRPTNDDQILVVPGDITDRKTADCVISEGLARFGRIDTLINNAGVFVAKPFTQYSEADYAAVLGVNLTGFFHITQLAIAEMEKRHSGHVVQITTSLIEHANSHVPSVPAPDSPASSCARPVSHPADRPAGARPGHSPLPSAGRQRSPCSEWRPRRLRLDRRGRHSGSQPPVIGRERGRPSSRRQ
jgi:NAD(P)-dependent dehydrogenase (short-subunit alcohol dehydrogenase family)